MPVVRFPPGGAGRQDRSQEEAATKERAQNEPAQRRKLIAFDAETWTALDLLARDSMKSIQELADEAFADLLKKHHRPADLRQALRESARLTSGNEDRTDTPKRPRNRPTK